ncbi:TPA: deoxyhypusine synthase [Candidatus Woesearchaeota archaeon]|nr:deoxyhypusine synthase [Candidatus Woesearchaeota archaeon]
MTHDIKHLKKVKHIETRKGMTADDLVREMGKSGVMGAGKIAHAADIAEKAVSDPKIKLFFGLAGAMVPGGMKQVIIDMLEEGWIDVFVTTGANLTHDLVEAIGYNHYQGKANVSDADLNKAGVDRMYDSYMPNNVYEGLEDFFAKNFEKLQKRGKMNIKEFLWAVGEMVPEGTPSILKTCAKKKIPIFCPAISDSGIGLMIWGHLAKGKELEVNVFDDLKEILNMAWDEDHKFAVWYCGGGVPKNFIQQAMQFAPEAAEYGIQITMDRPEPGGSSGANLAEGISWGKMNEKGNFVDVICDTTIALPLIVAAVKTRLGK